MSEKSFNELGLYELIINRNRFTWYDGEELVATFEIVEEQGVKWICAVYVSPLYRRKGYATSMLDIAIKLGVRRLTVEKNNTMAIALYEKMKFKVFDDDKTKLYMKW